MFSPHVYTGDVTGNYGYSDAAWESHWGYLANNHPTNEAAIVIGEFGTKKQLKWLGDLVDYLIGIDQRNHFFWCLNPNSGDTGGLLKDDWTTDETSKLQLLDTLQPNPSRITVTLTQICVSGLGETSSVPSGTPSSGSDTPTPTTSTSSGNVPTPRPTSSTSSSTSSSSTTITITQNGGVSAWWYAVELSSTDFSRVTKLEFQDSSHTEWITGIKLSWNAIQFPNGYVRFSGSHHFKVTTSDGVVENRNVFDGISAGASATLTIASSSFTDEDNVGDGIQLTWAGLVAIIVASLLCILCIGGGIWYCKKNKLDHGQKSFEKSMADTPQPAADTNELEEEIEVEMNMTEDGVAVTSTQD